ncbi:MAG: quinoprotein dehydrogenase-associated putative ABC transporter substrate-binding protein [Acidobacteriaceae bacterium]|nr:quinoprotein dehydrogenase-associated putative ABC transporter substrate-binding protein [Acidobacteriaceae bacterium]
MKSRRLVLLCVLVLTGALATAGAAGQELRVCADPDNLPFSNDRFEGFENKIAEVIGNDLHASLRYAWFPQSRMSIRDTLNAGKCDVIVGAPAEWSPVLTTRPYYASSYVFVYPKNKHLNLSSFDDPALRSLKIGLPAIAGEGANPPPAYALARRGLNGNVVGFSMFQPAEIIQAVAAGKIDVAIVWGPLGGYFATRQSTPLAVTPVAAGDDDSSLRFTYDISMGVRRGDTALKERLERALDRSQKHILKVLQDYGVPVVALPGDDSDSIPAKSIY